MVIRTVASAVLLCACASVDLAPMQTQSKLGPASTRTLTRIVALPATCGTMQVDYAPEFNKPPPDDKSHPDRSYSYDHATALCAAASLVGVDQIVRSSLDFMGYHVIDAERVNAVAADRREVVERTSAIDRRRRRDNDATTIETRGALFEDATPREQAEILHELRADGVLATRVWFGTGEGVSGRHPVVVQVRLAASADHALVWARRCELEIAMIGDAISVERVARCAAEVVKP